MTGWETRLRAILADNLAIVVVALLALAAIGGGLVVTAEPTEITDHRTVTLERGTGTFDHRATVVRENPVFRNGSTLEDRSVYFTGVMPVLNGTFEYTYDSDYGGTLRAEVTTRLVIRAVGDDGSTEYWRHSRRLDATERTLAPGETVRSTYAVNVSAVERRVDEIRSQLGAGPGQEEVLVVADVTVNGTIDGRSLRRQRTYAQRIEPSTDVYRVTSVTSGTNRTTVRDPVTRTIYPYRREYLGYALLAIGGVGGLGLLLVVGVAGVGAIDPADRERHRLRFASQRSEYDEWVTVASLPPEIEDRPRIEVERLEGLVDVAIDTDARVLERPDGSAYHVLGDEVLYVFTPPGAGERAGRLLGPEEAAPTPADDVVAEDAIDWDEALAPVPEDGNETEEGEGRTDEESGKADGDTDGDGDATNENDENEGSSAVEPPGDGAGDDRSDDIW
jgi:hypothetical protein